MTNMKLTACMYLYGSDSCEICDPGQTYFDSISVSSFTAQHEKLKKVIVSISFEMGWPGLDSGTE